MDIKTKLAYVEQHIKGISLADDADSIVRGAALDRIVAMVEAERAAMTARAQVAVAEFADPT